MSAKSLQFFGPPTTKWRPCKAFSRLNGSRLLMANASDYNRLKKLYNKCKDKTKKTDILSL